MKENETWGLLCLAFGVVLGVGGSFFLPADLMVPTSIMYVLLGFSWAVTGMILLCEVK